jgi:hypothetical protein
LEVCLTAELLKRVGSETRNVHVTRSRKRRDGLDARGPELADLRSADVSHGLQVIARKHSRSA